MTKMDDRRVTSARGDRISSPKERYFCLIQNCAVECFEERWKDVDTVFDRLSGVFSEIKLHKRNKVHYYVGISD